MVTSKGLGTKLFAVFMAIVLAMGMSVMPRTALADDPATGYTITIQSPESGHTYGAYQIFKGDVSGDANAPVLSNVEWGAGVKGAELLSALKDDATIGSSFADATTAADVAKVLGANNTAAFADAFAKVVNDHLDASTGTSTQSQSATPVSGRDVYSYTIPVAEAGYYFVKDTGATSPSYTKYILQVSGATPNVTVSAKTDTPTLEKKVQENTKFQDSSNAYGTGFNDTADYSIGDVIPFKVIGSVPDMSAYSTYTTYTFHDTLSAGLTAPTADHVQIYLASSKAEALGSVTEGKNITDKFNVQVSGQEITASLKDGQDLKTIATATDDNYVIMAYEATLNANAGIGQQNPANVNEAYLTYTNNPNTSGTGDTPHDKVIVFTYQLNVNKVSADNPETNLPGAKFKLAKGGSSTEFAVVENGKLTGWNATGTELTTDDNGLISIAGLDDGTYSLVETQAPEGYNKAATPWTITISADTTNGQEGQGAVSELRSVAVSVNSGDQTSGNVEKGTVETQVTNAQGFTLPSTGDLGTKVLTIAGIAIIAAAAITVAVRRRAKDSANAR